MKLKAGETHRFDCTQCTIEFEVTFEPKAKGDPSSQKSIKPAEVTTCPFCGDDLEEDDEEEDD